MNIGSMTGFARAEGQADGLTWSWEVKSVNSKTLDLRFRLPSGFDALELPLRVKFAERCRRGAFTAGLTLTRAAATGALRINREALSAVVALMRELRQELDVAPPRLDGLLALKGVLERGGGAGG